MNDEQIDDIFKELRDDLAAVRPSPEFRQMLMLC